VTTARCSGVLDGLKEQAAHRASAEHQRRVARLNLDLLESHTTQASGSIKAAAR
jgi:hypothetical protein